MNWSEPERKTLKDVLPFPQRYYLLTDGRLFARFGRGEAVGILVFLIRERAEQFAMTIANRNAGKWRPVKVSAETMLNLIDEVGAIARIEGRELVVTKIERIDPE